MTSGSIIVAAGAAVALLSASSAAAEPFETFLDMCVGADATAASAVAAAESAGWTKLPSDMFSPEDMPFEEPSIHVNSLPDDGKAPAALEMLLTGWVDGRELFAIDGIRMETCAIGTEPADPAQMASRMEDYLGFAPVMLEGQQAWLYSREGSHFRSESALLEAEDGEIGEAALRRKLLLAAVVRADGPTVLLLGAVRPNP